MTLKTYLQVPPTRASSAREAGAIWDAEVRAYFAPPGLDLALFSAWLPAQSASLAGSASAPSTTTELTPSAGTTALAPVTKGVKLSQLLNGVASAVAAAYKAGIWTTVEVTNVNSRGGHVYLELSERDQTGGLVAKATGTIWASTANRILPEFERATGASLAPGIKLLVRARPTYKPAHGFSVDIDAIDPAYTLGDLEARKREIRARLQAEGVFNAQKQLPSPWDYNAVLVVAPESAAGLGDFQAESRRLEHFGVCRFTFVASRFQGEGAASEIAGTIRNAFDSWPAAKQPDALVIIRGGGAVNDLAWLNDYDLARLVCEISVPVLTGVGHEKDSTILDEVAHLKFDTPSKVIAGIEQVIKGRRNSAVEAYDLLMRAAELATEKWSAASAKLDSDVRTGAGKQLELARRLSMEAVHQVKQSALGAMSTGRAAAAESINQVRAGAAVVVSTAKASSRASRDFVLERAGRQVAQGRADAQTARDLVEQGARQVLHQAKRGAEALMREIAGQGPEKTLGRGFAVVRDADGQAVTRADRASAMDKISVQFSDGVVHADVDRERK